MIKISFQNPYLVLVISLILMVISYVSISKLPVDILPMFKTSAVQVLTLYPGMPPEAVEKDITSRVERWTGQSKGIAWQESKSIIGARIARDHFREDIDPNSAMSHVTSYAMSDQYYSPPIEVAYLTNVPLNNTIPNWRHIKTGWTRLRTLWQKT